MALQNMSLVPLVLLCTNRIHHPGWHPLLGTQPLFFIRRNARLRKMTENTEDA